MYRGKASLLITGIGDFCAWIPWWLALLLAAGISFLLAGSGVPGEWVSGEYASALGYLLPALLAAVALCSLLRRRQRRNLATRMAGRSAHRLQALSRHDFRSLVAAVFRASGFEVEEQRRGGRGVDLIVVKERERYLIRCLPGDSGAAGEKELAGLAAAVALERAGGGLVAAAGSLGEGAKRFAKAEGLRQLEGRELHSRLQRQVEAGEFTPARSSLWKTDGRRLVVLLTVLILAAAALLTSDQGVRLRSLLADQVDRIGANGQLSSWFDSARRLLPGGDKEREFSFSPEQVDEAMENVLRGKNGGRNESDGEKDGEPVRYRYEIELHSGGWVDADTIDIGKETITYTSRRGLRVELDRGEVKAVRRIPLD